MANLNFGFNIHTFSFDSAGLQQASEVMHIPVDTRSAFPVISVQSPVSIQYRWQS